MPKTLALVLFLAVLLSSLPTLTAPADSPAPVLHLEETALVFERVQAGSGIAVIGVGRDRAGFLPHQLTVWEIVEADASGVGRLDLGQPLPTQSTWGGVDLATGEVVLAAPEGTPLREASLPARGLAAGVRALEDTGSSFALLWVRPAANGEGGAWWGAVSDGSALDGDEGENRSVRVLLDRLEPLGTSPIAPDHLERGDVLIGIDTDSLAVRAVRIAD